jgi:hypothetical protein
MPASCFLALDRLRRQFFALGLQAVEYFRNVGDGW